MKSPKISVQSLTYLTLALVLFLISAMMSGCNKVDQAWEQVDEFSHPSTDATMNQACLDDAQSQLSPQWGDASKLDRAIAAFQVINACVEE